MSSDVSSVVGSVVGSEGWFDADGSGNYAGTPTSQTITLTGQVGATAIGENALFRGLARVARIEALQPLVEDAAQRLAAVVRLDELPRSHIGKVLKRELRAPYWEGLTRQVN